jgi:hypothetical protein
MKNKAPTDSPLLLPQSAGGMMPGVAEGASPSSSFPISLAAWANGCDRLRGERTSRGERSETPELGTASGAPNPGAVPSSNWPSTEFAL